MLPALKGALLEVSRFPPSGPQSRRALVCWSFLQRFCWAHVVSVVRIAARCASRRATVCIGTPMHGLCLKALPVRECRPGSTPSLEGHTHEHTSQETQAF